MTVDMRAIRQAEGAENLEQHLASPEISVVDHYGTLMNQVASEAHSRRKLYLDTRYWVFIRDAAMGRARKREHEEILLALQKLVTSGLVICPISDVVLMEMTAQTDDETRWATAKLWDELSLGIALQTEQERSRTELEQFFRYPRLEDVRRPLDELVWTKPCFVFGAVFPHVEDIPASVNQALQKAILDTLWTTTFLELAKDSSAVLAMKEEFQRTAETINADMRKYQHEIPSFDKAFLAEVAGALDANEDLLGEVVVRQYGGQGHSMAGVTDEQLQSARKEMRVALTNAFRLKRDLMAKRLPTSYVHAMCHAAIRMDVNRKFNGNFLRDIHHGNAGVVYCDALFTEKPLSVLLTSGKLAVDKAFGCKVLHDERDVLTYLGSISPLAV